jgi:hypothetical protein
MRGEAHAFYRYEDLRVGDSEGLGTICSLATLSESPLGPVALALEWYAGEAEPWLLEFTLGYRIFGGSWRR